MTPATRAPNPATRARAERRNRQATPTQCPHCGTPTYTGPDRDRASLTVTINREPLTWAHELNTHLTGGHSYTLTRTNEIWDNRPPLPTTPNTTGTTHTDHTCP